MRLRNQLIFIFFFKFEREFEGIELGTTLKKKQIFATYFGQNQA